MLTGSALTGVSPALAQAPAALEVTSPAARAIMQRVDGELTPVTISGKNLGGAGPIDIRVVSRDELSPFETPWYQAQQQASAFSIEVSLPAGWFDVEARHASSPETVVRHGPIGVGEVFITAGQSNAANYGTAITAPGDERVSALDIDTKTWTTGADPQPSADGNAGSPWPTFATELAVALDMPVAVIAVGIGGDPIRAWDPRAPAGFTHYDRIREAIEQVQPNGLRAILWHQGESDVLTSYEDYREALEALIAQSRVDAKFDVPWGVAIVSNGLLGANVIKAQRAVIANDPLVYEGANTNDFRWRGYMGDLVHFNLEGLIEHAHRWAIPTIDYFELVPLARQPGDVDCSLGPPNRDDVVAASRAAVDLPVVGPAGLVSRCTADDGTDKQRCDVDANGTCDVRDALIVAQCKAGQSSACSILDNPGSIDS